MFSSQKQLINPSCLPKTINGVGRIFIWLFFLLLLVFIIGLIGFRILFNFGWVDAFHNTAVTMSTLGIHSECNVETDNQKIFVGIYALISGALYLSIISLIVIKFVKLYE